MRKYILLGTCIAMLFGCAKEEDVTPSENRNLYDLPDFSSPEEMEIRKNFYKETGSFLLFNDSLGYSEKHTPQGSQQICEVLDLHYEITSNIKHVFNFTYLKESAKQQQAADWLAKEVLPMLPAVLRPAAILLTDDFLFQEYKFSYISYKYELLPPKIIGAYSTYNATIVGCNDIFEMASEEKQAYVRDIIKVILLRNASRLDDKEYAAFYQYSDAYYGTYDPNNESVGFLPEIGGQYNCSKKSVDLQSYIQEIFSMTEEEFTEKYASWDLVLKKRDALVKILEKHGVKVY